MPRSLWMLAFCIPVACGGAHSDSRDVGAASGGHAGVPATAGGQAGASPIGGGAGHDNAGGVAGSVGAMGGATAAGSGGEAGGSTQGGVGVGVGGHVGGETGGTAGQPDMRPTVGNTPMVPSGTPPEPPMPLTAGRKTVLSFPELPPSLFTRQNDLQGDAAVTKATFTLPSNYDSAKWMPALVFLQGGGGGAGTSTGKCDNITGRKDFVCINMPIFVTVRNGTFQLVVGNGDHEINWNSFDTMLRAINKRVPNIDWSRSALGGFSNGANTTAALMIRPAFEIGRYFRLFYLVESGYSWNRTDNVPAGARILLMEGDTGDQRLLPAWMRAMRDIPAQVEYIEMANTGHSFPSAYEDELLGWVNKHSVAAQ